MLEKAGALEELSVVGSGANGFHTPMVAMVYPGNADHVREYRGRGDYSSMQFLGTGGGCRGPLDASDVLGAGTYRVSIQGNRVGMFRLADGVMTDELTSHALLDPSKQYVIAGQIFYAGSSITAVSVSTTATIATEVFNTVMDVGTGPSCEYSNGATCSGNGVAQYDGTCACADPVVGTGPSCSECSNGATCSGNGVTHYDGTCECNTWKFDGDDCGSPSPGLVAMCVIISAIVLAVLWIGVVNPRVVRPALARLRPALARRRQSRLDDAHGREHPLELQTLGGDQYTVYGWGAAKRLDAAITQEHPGLVRNAGFRLVAAGPGAEAPVEVDFGCGTASRAALLAGELPLLLTLVFEQDLQSAEKEAGDGANDNDRPLTVDGADELVRTTTV